MRNSIAAGRRLALHMLGWQAGLTLSTGAVFLLLQGPRASAAAAFGGLVVMLPTLYMAFQMFVRGASANGQQVLGILYRAEAGKWVLTALLFALGALWFGDEFAPLMLTSVACLAVNWWMLAVTRSH